VSSSTTDAGALPRRWVVAADGHYSPTRRLVDGRTGRWRRPAPPRSWPPAPAGGGAPPGPVRGAAAIAPRASGRRSAVLEGVAVRRCGSSSTRPAARLAWIFPCPTAAPTWASGAAAAGLDGKALARIWRELPDRPGIRAVLGASAEPDGRPAPGRSPRVRRARLACGRVLFVGDAAAVADPMTGEGVAQALETGTLASAAIADGSADPAVAYAEAVDRSLGADVRFSRALSWVLARRRGAECSLRAVDLNDWTRRNFARWMWRTTPGRWSSPTAGGAARLCGARRYPACPGWSAHPTTD